MIVTAAAAMLWGALGIAASATDPTPLQFAQVTIRRQIIIRTVRIREQPSNTRVAGDWKEGKVLQCVRAGAIAGAALIGQRSVDLVLHTGVRVRARLVSSCPALDYYSGFYITPGQDGLVCKDRESIRSRAGGQCEIDSFQLLQATPKSPPTTEAAVPAR